ncbi:MAG: hypothetical protein JNJ88_21665 [Planctomycetes bacterium]|nr:hypothetical protein [Planctomycetota bacterium]
MRSNPVAYIQEALSGKGPKSLEETLRELPEGTHLPTEFRKSLLRSYRGRASTLIDSLRRTNSDRIGPIGLVVDEQTGTGFVVPIAVNLEGRHSPQLPFRPEDALQVLQLLLLASSPLKGIPGFELEHLGFEESSGLAKSPKYGPSMDIVAALSVLDFYSARQHPALSAACAVVELHPRDRHELSPVGCSKQKLEAFVREHEKGSLLIRHSADQEAAQFDKYFSLCWSVDTVKSLSDRLEEKGLLEPLWRKSPIGPDEFKRVLNAVDSNSEGPTQAYAIELAQALCEAPRTSQVSDAAILEAEALRDCIPRHLGDDLRARSLSTASARKRRSRFDDLKRMYVENGLYAAFYDSHDFQRMVRALTGWKRLMARKATFGGVPDRVPVRNTWARAAGAISVAGWEAAFLTSVKEQMRTDKGTLPRTLCYLAEEYLRHGMLGKAKKIIDKAEASLEEAGALEDRKNLLAFPQGQIANANSLWAIYYLRSELGRTMKRSWQDETATEIALSGRVCSYTTARYMQAIARSNYLLHADLSRAVGELTCAVDGVRRSTQYINAPPGSPTILHFVLWSLQLLHAAWTEDTKEWRGARKNLRHFFTLKIRRPMKMWYSEPWSGIGEKPSPDAAERLVGSLIWFNGPAKRLGPARPRQR